MAYSFLFTTAGFPAASESAGMSCTTTLPAAMMHLGPIVTPGNTVTPPPSQQLSPIVIGKQVSTGCMRSCQSIGCCGVKNWQRGPILQ